MPQHDHPSSAGRHLPQPTLVDEVEAYLGGWYATIVGGDDPDGWVAVNRVAHAHPTVIRLLAQGDAPPSRWLSDEQQVARALVLKAGDSDDALRSLQVEAVVPLELWLAGDGRSIGLSGHGALQLALEAVEESTTGA